MLERVAVPEDVKARVYACFFEAVRACHAGHALALTGLDRQLDARAVLVGGETAALESAVAAIERLRVRQACSPCRRHMEAKRLTQRDRTVR